MSQAQHDPLKVDVPVGFLLSETREILVSVDRPYDVPLAIKLRLVPAEVGATPVFVPRPTRASADGSSPVKRTARRRKVEVSLDQEYGGCD